MDVSKLSPGEKIAGGSGIALILFMFIFDWFGLKGAPSNFGGLNAWDAFSFIDIILFITALSAIALAYMSASGTAVSLPVAMSAIVTGLGILATVLILFRIISPPSYDILGSSVDTSRKFGVFLGLIASAGIAYGGYTAMQEEGTSFGDARNTGGGSPPASGGPGAPPAA